MPSTRRGYSPAPQTSFAKLLRALILVAAPLLVVATPRAAHAYTWMISHGYSGCTACHTDPSGGELLTTYGRVLSGEVLSMKWGGSSSDSATWGTPSRLARKPESFAARAKLAGKDEATDGEQVELEDDGAEPAADAKPVEGAEAEAEPEADAAQPEAATAEAATSEPELPADITPFMFGVVPLPDWLALGASYRHMNIITPKFRTFPMMMDVYGQVQFGSFKFGGSIGAARVAAGSPYARAAQVTANQGKQFNLLSRTHYVGYEITPELQVRAGRLNLPFGIRTPEHTLWVRQATRTDRESAQQTGLSVFYGAESFRLEVQGIAGNYQINPDEFRERGYAGYFEYFVNSKTGLGINSLVTVAKNDRNVLDGQSMTRMAHGGMFRSAMGDHLVALMELNALIRSRFEVGYVGFAQLDFQAVQGLHFMVTGEILDEGHSKAASASAREPGAGKPRVGGWASASWWFLPHFDVRLDAIKRTQEDVQVLAQLHCYL